MNKLDLTSNLVDTFNSDSAIRNMSKSYLVGQDLSNMDLSHSILNEAELDCATLNNTNLTKASLHKTSFFSADLQGVRLSFAKVKDCNFRHANLENANLEGVDFSSSDVSGAIFTDAIGLSNQQKIWLKNNGALNICLETNQFESANQNKLGLIEKFKLLFRNVRQLKG